MNFAVVLYNNGFIDEVNPVADGAQLPVALLRASAAADGVAGTTIAQSLRGAPTQLTVLADGTPALPLLEAISALHGAVPPPRASSDWADVVAPAPARVLANALRARLEAYARSALVDDAPDEGTRATDAACVRDAELSALRACLMHADARAAQAPAPWRRQDAAAWDLF